MRVAAALFAVLALAACQTPCPASGTAVTRAFHCEDGSDLTATFTPDQAVIVQEGYVTLTLQSRVAGTGFRYADNGAELRGRVGEARWTRPGAEETICTATE